MVLLSQVAKPLFLYVVWPHETIVIEKYDVMWFSLLSDKKPVDKKSATLFTRRPVKEDISLRRQQSMERLYCHRP